MINCLKQFSSSSSRSQTQLDKKFPNSYTFIFSGKQNLIYYINFAELIIFVLVVKVNISQTEHFLLTLTYIKEDYKQKNSVLVKKTVEMLNC